MRELPTKRQRDPKWRLRKRSNGKSLGNCHGVLARRHRLRFSAAAASVLRLRSSPEVTAAACPQTAASVAPLRMTRKGGSISSYPSIVLISTGSTLTPSSSSQAMALLISARSPSSESETMPISSVTLACRMFVTTSNFLPSSQRIGRDERWDGKISQRRWLSGIEVKN